MGRSAATARRAKTKRVSKHVISSQDRAQQEGGGGVAAGVDPSSAADDAVGAPSKRGRREKDPSEAASYLSSWRHRDAGGGVWKFNKNTQSWLVRHMYDADRISKGTFDDLADYLGGLPAGATRSRVREDAARRASRYKRWEKSGGGSGGEETAEVPTKRTEDGDDAPESGGGAAGEGGDSDERWAALDDKNKRKEYKRARKILDAVSALPSAV